MTFALDKALEALGASQAPTGYRIFRKIVDYIWSGLKQEHIDGTK